MAVRRRETLLVFAPILIGGAFLAYAMASTAIETRAKETAAISAGFANSAEMLAAKTSGIDDAAAWREKVKTEAEKRAADEAQRQKAWDVQLQDVAKNAAKTRDEEEIRTKNMRLAEAEASARLAEQKRNPADRMTMPNFNWKAGGFGSVGIVSPTIQNGNDFAVKDIGIVCNFSGKSGTELSARAAVIYDAIPAKSRKTFKDFNIGLIDSQSARASCRIISAMRV
jgi:hypothetical protein